MFKKVRFVSVCVLVFLLSVLVTACSSNSGELSTTPEDGEEKISVMASISIIGNMAENIVGTRGEVSYLVPIGDNPEDYELSPSELQIINDADLFFINGMGLEEVIENTLENISDTPVIEVTANIKAIPLEDSTVPDPHAWLSAEEAKTYVKNITKSLIEIDPEGKEYYQENALTYRNKLLDLHNWIQGEVERIPKENKIIIVSENALKYYGKAYGFQTEGIWELNSHEEGTPRQMSRLVELIKDKKIPALFVESTLDRRYMETISNETGVPIAAEVYTDALGKKGSGAETYIKMMKHNTQAFVNNLRE